MLYIWLAVIFALILVEALSRNFTAACFILSAIVSLICTLYNDEYVMQVILFLVIGVLLLIFVRPNVVEYIKNHFPKKDKKEKEKAKEPEKKASTPKKSTAKKSVKK